MGNPEMGGYTPETKQSKVWEEEGTVYITDPETGMIIHDKEITLDEAKKVKGAKILLDSGDSITFAAYYKEGTAKPVKSGEECAYVGQKLKGQDGKELTVTGFEYSK